MTKQELRSLIRQLKKEHSIGAADPCEVLLQHQRLTVSRIILAYSALPDEVPTQQLLDNLVRQGKTVLLPRVVNDTDMELRRYTGQHDLSKGAYGIMEPTGPIFTDYSTIDVAVIPGMAFDAEGHRLGRGKGYYDRLFARVPYIYKLGLCYSWQMVDRVPCDAHDILMDDVIRI